ncbi:MAG: DNA polymerase III subunit beta [Bacteroidales bacterium]|nr:DNA polymerase III subunit beta [Bacteroidales bacterium]
MNFVVSSTELLNHLLTVNKVISSKNTLPILDNFLINLKEKELTITASDLETTLISKMTLENVDGDGEIAIDAKRLTNILKEFSDQPLTFNIDTQTLAIDILSENGKFSVVGQSGEDFPQLPNLKEDKATKIPLKSELLLNGLSKTIFATADDELRPVMNGVFVELSPENLTFVASDAHKLVRYKRGYTESEISSSFILPQKPSSLLKNILSKDDSPVNLEFDDKNAFFQFSNFKLTCRLVEGNYPSYESVIPVDNPNKLIIDRQDFYNTLKRVSVFSNQASNLIKLSITGNQMTVSAQDLDFSISAHERIKCQYDGAEMEIGFKSIFLIEILSNISSPEIIIELSDPSRAGIILPVEKEFEDEDLLMLIMPMMINT